jgi:hypothetical protein
MIRLRFIRPEKVYTAIEFKPDQYTHGIPIQPKQRQNDGTHRAVELIVITEIGDKIGENIGNNEYHSGS